MDDDKDHTYIGFPFCLGMLAGSALFHFFCLAAISPQLSSTKVKVKVRRTYEMEESNDVKSTYVPPMTSLNEVSKPEKSSTEPAKNNVEPVKAPISPVQNTMVGHDNQVFSEKL